MAPYPDETVAAATGGGVDEQSSGKNFLSNMSCSTTRISLSSKTCKKVEREIRDRP